ncbi:MAG: GDSL-type esterase/lipase family protein [Verrucomicrobiales bacterium]
MSLLFRAFFLFAAILSAAAQSNPYESNIRAFEQADLRNPPPENAILVLGSSTIVNWSSLSTAFPRYNVLNRGFGGSQGSDVLFFFDRIVPPYKSPLILYYEGDNDLASGKSVQTIFNEWLTFVSRVHTNMPEAHILYLAVKPSPSRANLIQQQRALNERIRLHATTDSRLHFADTFTPFLTASGQLRPELYVGDQLHLSPAGYEVWEAAIVPIVDSWVARHPINIMKAESNAILIDFGAPNSMSGSSNPSVVHWNNITAIGSTDSGALSNLVSTSGRATTVALKMVSRFNGANENGATTSTNFPASSTRDSLFGNTATFNGLANITPIFQLVGLDSAAPYMISFYASRTGVSDNRETRYTVQGANTQTTDLNVANNINNVAHIEFIQADDNGTLRIALTPGSNNNNGNRFTYLGVLRVQSLAPGGPAFLFDFGSASSISGEDLPPPPETWNNLSVDIGTTDSGVMENLLATNGLVTAIDLQMLSRFNTFNENGTTASSLFTPSATSDSLFGNTESFNGLSNIAPAFKMTGLNPAAIYNLHFYASRVGVTDQRDTRYMTIGAATNFIELNAANNTNNVATLANLRPDAQGELKIEISPGAGNNSPNHFTYLGVLRLSWTVITPRQPALISPVHQADGSFTLQLLANPGDTCIIQSSTDLQTWTDIQTVVLITGSHTVELPGTKPYSFFRVVQTAI